MGVETREEKAHPQSQENPNREQTPHCHAIDWILGGEETQTKKQINVLLWCFVTPALGRIGQESELVMTGRLSYQK